MIPVHQTRFGEQGNCLAACFASILEVSLADVDFSCSDAAPGEWYWLALSRLASLGYGFFDVRAGRNKDGEAEICIPNGEYFIASGKTTRGPILHSVVCHAQNRRWSMVHDPHPDGTMLSSVVYFGMLVPLRKKVDKEKCLVF